MEGFEAVIVRCNEEVSNYIEIRRLLLRNNIKYNQKFLKLLKIQRDSQFKNHLPKLNKN